MRWFKHIATRDHLYQALSWEEKGMISVVLEDCQVSQNYELSVERLAKLLKIHRRKAAKLMPLFTPILVNFWAKIGQKLGKNWAKIGQKNAGNPLPDSPPIEEKRIDREKKEKNKKEQSPPTGGVTAPGSEASASAPSKSKLVFDERHLTLAKELWELIHDKYPYYKPPNMDSWADTIRKIERLDGFSIDQIEDVAAWALTKSDFWSQQIRGPDNLRKHFRRLIDQSDLYAKWERQRNVSS